MKEDIALVGIDETKTTIRDELFDGTLRHDRDSRNKKQENLRWRRTRHQRRPRRLLSNRTPRGTQITVIVNQRTNERHRQSNCNLRENGTHLMGRATLTLHATPIRGL
jgi:hypothetical protein